jgi:receptor protein-tyrosine kinase
VSTIQKAMGKLKSQQNRDNKSEEAINTEFTPPIKAERDSELDNVLTQDVSEVTESAVDDKEIIELDLHHLKSLGMIDDTTTIKNKRMNDEFRTIKHKLLKNAFGENSNLNRNGQLVMVTSSSPNEGKTFISINLALSMALEKNKTVLLVDSDILKPSVSKCLAIEERVGLIEYLNGEIEDIGDVIYSTSIPNLKLIPAGKPHYQGHELLTSDRMTSLTKELSKRYSDRIVLFDSPPINGVVETVVLSSLMGQAMVVVEQDKTKMSDLKSAISNLHEELIIGLILNKAVRGSFSNLGYGYGYGSYGYGSSETSSSS